MLCPQTPQSLQKWNPTPKVSEKSEKPDGRFKWQCTNPRQEAEPPVMSPVVHRTLTLWTILSHISILMAGVCWIVDYSKCGNNSKVFFYHH